MRNFNFNRLVKFIQRQLTMNSNSLILGASSIFGSMFLLTAVVAYFHPTNLENIMKLHIVVFYITGYLLSSKAFAELNNPKKGYFYLTLPVSTLEKVAGSWILTSPLYVLSYCVFLLITFFTVSLITNISFGSTPLFNPRYLENIPAYLVVQTLFFLGACYFKGNNFLKTILSIVLLIIGLSIFSAILGYLLFIDGVHKEDIDDGLVNFVRFDLLHSFTMFFWYLLGPFLLVVSYFKLKERQI